MKPSIHLRATWCAALLAGIGILLSGCGSDSSSPAGNSAIPGSTTSTLSGTAATGAAMAGYVYVKDANGGEINVAINNDGSYSADVSGMTAPFVLRAIPNDTTLAVHYSYAGAANVTVNVTPLTSLALFLANNQQDLAVLSAGQVDTTALANAITTVRSNFTAQFSAQGLPGDYDFFASAFSADGSGFDAVLDAIEISFDMGAGSFAVTLNGSSFDFNSGGTDNTGGGTTATTTALGLVSGGFAAGTNAAERVANVSGTWDVAIYRTPANQTSLIGPAKLSVSETGGVREIKLTKTDGTLISKATSDGNPYLDPATAFQVYSFGAAYLVGINGTSIDKYLVAQFNTNGEIYGSAGGFGEIAFRNNISAYGSNVPAVFTALAGNWSGAAGDLTCQPNPLSVGIGADGSVSYQGKLSLSCADTTVDNQWDGNDDYIIPTSTGYTLALDSAKGGGSQAGGGIIVKLATLDSPSAIVEISTTANGAAGDMNLYNPARQ